MQIQCLVRVLIVIAKEGYDEAVFHLPDPGRVVKPPINVLHDGADEREPVAEPAHLLLHIDGPVHERFHFLAD